MLKTNTIAGIFNLDIKEDIDEVILDFFNIRITNIKKKYQKLLNENVVSIIGLNENHFLLNSKQVLLNEFDYDIDPNEFDPKPNLEKILVIVEFFCQALWLIKDNSVEIELAHILYKTDISQNVHSNFWNSSYSNSIGQRISTTFSKEEIIESQDLLKIVLSIMLAEDEKVEENIILTNRINRLSRAFIFLKSARITNDIGTKISIYCSVFESLFSVSTSELRHRLSETISFFLSKNYNERVSIYKTIQKAYDIRSSIVHGDGLTKKYTKNNKLLFEIAIETDNILRKCIRKILKDKELYILFTKQNKDEISKYFKKLIFE